MTATATSYEEAIEIAPESRGFEPEVEQIPEDLLDPWADFDEDGELIAIYTNPPYEDEEILHRLRYCRKG